MSDAPRTANARYLARPRLELLLLVELPSGIMVCYFSMIVGMLLFAVGLVRLVSRTAGASD